MTKTFDVVFEKRNSRWGNSYTNNEIFIRGSIDYVNALLVYEDYVFVSDLLHILNCPLTKDSIVYGWKKGECIKDFKIKKKDSNTIIISFEAKYILDCLPD